MTTTTTQVTRNVTFHGDYASTVTDKTQFLQECTTAFVPAVCVDVLPGSIIVVLQGASYAEVDGAIAEIPAQGISLTTFGTLRQVTTTTTTTVDRSMDNCSLSGVAPEVCGSLLTGQMAAKGDRKSVV